MASDHSATIVDGRLARTSPSALKTFRRCGLKWYHGKVLKTTPKARSTKGADLGKAEHDGLETYLKTGVDTRLRIAKAVDLMSPYMPLMPFNGGPAIIEGDLKEPDLLTPGGVAVTGRYDVFIPHVEWPIIIDHKFKADVKWFDSLEALRSDEQSIIYGAWAVQRCEGAQGYEFRHHNHQTKGYLHSEPRSVRVTRDEVLKRFQSIAKTIDTDMAGCLSVTNVDDVPYNKHACFDFGGCEYAHACHRHPGNSGFTALQKAIDDMGFKLKQSESESEAAVLPPDAPPRDQVDPVVLAPPLPAWGLNDEGDFAVLPAAPTPTEKPKKAKAAKKEEAPVTAPAETHCLYVNCAPVGVAYTDALAIAVECADKLAKKLSLIDIRLAGADSPLGYGKWKPALVAALKELNLKGHIVVYTGNELAESVIEAYTPGALMIVRAR